MEFLAKWDPLASPDGKEKSDPLGLRVPEASRESRDIVVIWAKGDGPETWVRKESSAYEDPPDQRVVRANRDRLVCSVPKATMVQLARRAR